jgi:sarcosine oxidase, subunit beta
VTQAQTSDVLVIGGGLAGCATAYYLAKDGVGATLLEQGDLNTQASGSNAGSIHVQIPHADFMESGEDWARAYAPTIPLLMRSVAMWSALGEELGVDLEVALPGGLLVAGSAAEMRDIERKAAIEREQGLPVELIDRAALRRLAPYVSDRMVGGAFCPGEGKANPLVAATAFATAAEARGAVIHRRTQVTGIEPTPEGFVAHTSAGPYRARRLVNAAGARAGDVARMVGIELAMEGFPIQVSVTEPAEPLVEHLVYFAGAQLTLKQTRIGTLLIGGGWPARLDAQGRPVADPNSLAANLAVALEVVPALGRISVVRTWAAMVNGNADWKPILGEVPRARGFFVNFFPWMGFSGGPVAARVVASLVQGRTPPVDVDLRPFAPM